MLCVIARIDESSRKKLLLLQAEAKKHNIEPRYLHGHITLAVYTGEDEAAFMSSCRSILERLRPFKVRYEHLKILREPSTIVVCPTKEGTLAEIQQQVVDAWAEELNIWSQPGIWLPHTTLVQDQTANLDAVLETVQHAFEPFGAVISRIEFSAVRPDGYEIIGYVDLK